MVGQPIIELDRALQVESVSEFARLVAKRAAPEYVSPYQVQYPVGERMLFGRDALVANLRTAKRHQIVVGARRIGKTSVVKAVQRAGLPNGGKIVYVDMADVGQDGWQSLWHELLIGLGVASLLALRQRANPGALRSHGLGSLAVGVVHGLAGSAAVALLAGAAMASTAAAIAYLLVFALGTVGGMIALSFGLGLPAVAARRRPALARALVATSGVVSVALGVHLALGFGSAALAAQ